jgi:gluconate 2-dehydrogenase gamma chain
MQRREALRLIASTAAVPAFQGLHESQLLVLGRRIHAAARDAVGPIIGALNAHQRATVVVAAERIIPATDTPGASDARVVDFIDRMLAEWYPAEDLDRFLAGLRELDGRAQHANARAFIDCAAALQIQLLTTLDDEVAALRQRGPASSADRHWFAMLKYLTIWGYCTSEAVQTDVLKLYPLPGRFDGCARV